LCDKSVAMAEKSTDVKKIKEFLTKKIENLRKKVSEFEGPITTELIRTSTHMQLDYLSLKAELKANEENLLAIETFCPDEA
jgi:hypothetical protein